MMVQKYPALKSRSPYICPLFERRKLKKVEGLCAQPLYFFINSPTTYLTAYLDFKAWLVVNDGNQSRGQKYLTTVVGLLKGVQGIVTISLIYCQGIVKKMLPPLHASLVAN